jgi:hypothetical protein
MRNREYSNVQDDDEDEDDDEVYGPPLPNQVTTSSNPRSGPTIPNLQDLEIQRGMFSIANDKFYY